MKCCTYDTKRYFLFWMRIFFGVWFLYAGISKWANGSDGFVQHITTEFQNTWSPYLLTVILAWVIIIAEPLLALFILFGRRQRTAWSLTAGLMFLLLMGQTLLMKPDVIANWQFLVLTLICAAMSDPEDCGDHKASTLKN